MATAAPSCLTEEGSAKVTIQIAKPVLQPRRLYLISKRVFDLAFSFLGLLILTLPMTMIAPPTM